MPYIEFDPIKLPEGVHVTRPAFCVSDVHGSSSLFAEAMDDALSEPGDPLIAMLGDLVNRGYHSMICVMVALEVMKTAKNAVNIRGNHCVVAEQAALSRNRESMIFLEKHGGGWLLDTMEAAEKGVPQALCDMETIRKWSRTLSDYHIHSDAGRGAILMTHATPDPIKPIGRCSSEDLRWSYPEEKRSSRSALVGGIPCLNVHGHVSSEYRNLSLTKIERRARKMVLEEGRLNIDGGLPFKSRLIMARISGDEVVLRIYSKR